MGCGISKDRLDRHRGNKIKEEWVEDSLTTRLN